MSFNRLSRHSIPPLHGGDVKMIKTIDNIYTPARVDTEKKSPKVQTIVQEVSRIRMPKKRNEEKK